MIEAPPLPPAPPGAAWLAVALETGHTVAASSVDAPALRWPVGSVFKLVAFRAALRDPAWAEPGRRLRCAGAYPAPGAPDRCWKPEGHGALSLDQALARSCNGVYYALGAALGGQALAAEARRDWGLVVPPARFKRPAARLGDDPALRVSLGTLAADVRAIATDPSPAGRRLRAAMTEAARSGSGKAAGKAAFPWRVAGKTGTATMPDGSNRTSGLFVGFAPAEAPRYAVVAGVREGSGFAEAATLAGRVLAWLRARDAVLASLRSGAGGPSPQRSGTREHLEPLAGGRGPSPQRSGTGDGSRLAGSGP